MTFTSLFTVNDFIDKYEKEEITLSTLIVEICNIQKIEIIKQQNDLHKIDAKEHADQVKRLEDTIRELRARNNYLEKVFNKLLSFIKKSPVTDGEDDDDDY